jgi:hypothetical protein
MGLGTPPQILKMIALGVDMFDCVLPSRVARNGLAFTPTGRSTSGTSGSGPTRGPIVEGLDNYTCRNFSRAYLRHLIMAGEMLGGTLVTIHNLHFFLNLVEQARAHIEAGDYGPWHLGLDGFHRLALRGHVVERPPELARIAHYVEAGPAEEISCEVRWGVHFGALGPVCA